MGNLNLIPLNEQILFHLKDNKTCKLTNAQERRLDPILPYMKYYNTLVKRFF